ncbi:hypothetical protein PENDEC_c015G00387 [Penicillium decumbens]|uniref:Myb-like domain-containing protein n=1 Tax=Penicillium decumbens TaxID=69771 RepID=A0A1V6P926_PENDC|nr:hypothetical protein PENDEC_c015G00387 [Penicillium decumbens]
MSDSSEYEPDDSGSEYETESDFQDDELVVRSIERKTRSSSRAVSVSVKEEAEDISAFDFTAYVDDDMNPDARQDRVRSLQARLQAIPRGSINAYNNLLVEMGKDVALKNMHEHPELLTVEQYGSVIWTATEKEIFFNMLDRKGNNGIREIAAAIQTKSELEVMHYIDLLQEGLAKVHSNYEHNTLLLMGDYPGAAEVSRECEEKLDELADIMCMKEEAESSWASRERYHEYGIITEASAKGLVEAEVNPPLRGGIDKAANVLNVPMWLQLSQNLFMNFGGRRIEDNWIYLKSFSAESPSMTGDALMDFYALTMSITRRLVQSSFFFAMSRVRAMEQLGYEDMAESIQSVRTRDVKAALDTLNMDYDRGNLLVDFARRSGILIRDIRNDRGWKPRVLDYEEVEQLLSLDDDEYEEPGPGLSESEIEYDDDDDYDGEDEEEEKGEEEELIEQEQAETEGPGQKPQSHEPESGPEPEPEAGATIETTTNQPEQQPQPQPEPNPVPVHNQPTTNQTPLPRQRRYSEGSYKSSSDGAEEQASDAEEVHAAHQDQEYDRREEIRLRQILSQPIPPLLGFPIIPEEEMGEDSKDRPFVIRKSKEDMVGWRERTLYRAEWEELGDVGSGLEDDLQENRRKRRRIEAEEAAYRSGEESESESEEDDYFEDSEDGQGDQEDQEDQEDQDQGQEGQPVPISSSGLNSEDSEGDPMEIDKPRPTPTIAVELPLYGSPAWETSRQKPMERTEQNQN